MAVRGQVDLDIPAVVHPVALQPLGRARYLREERISEENDFTAASGNCSFFNGWPKQSQFEFCEYSTLLSS